MMPGFFEKLAADQRRIALDCDVTAGFWPARGDIDASPEAVQRLLSRGGIDTALATSAQACWYDEAGGADELRTWADDHGWLRCNAVNLRDAWGIGERLDAWVADGVGAIRLPSSTQGVPASAPGHRLVVEEAARRGLVMLTEGGFNQTQQAFRGLGAKVVFLEASYYELADFLIVARDEPHFVVSTRRMLGPDAIETICGEVGAAHIAFGSGAPLWDLEPSVWRTRDARISDEDFAAVTGGTLQQLLEA